MREGRLTAPKPVGLWGAYVMGLAFAFGWTPCIGPILAAASSPSPRRNDRDQRAPACAASIPPDLGIPFLLAAFMIEQFSELFVRMKQHLDIERAMGVAGGDHRHRLFDRCRLEYQYLAPGDLPGAAKISAKAP